MMMMMRKFSQAKEKRKKFLKDNAIKEHECMEEFVELRTENLSRIPTNLITSAIKSYFFYTKHKNDRKSDNL